MKDIILIKEEGLLQIGFFIVTMNIGLSFDLLIDDLSNIIFSYLTGLFKVQVV